MTRPLAGPAGKARGLFEELAAEHLHKVGVSLERVFHDDGLKVNAKLYAFESKDRLVLKLPAARSAELTSAGDASVFEPSPGRRMKEWIALDAPADETALLRWRELSEEAYRYVAALSAR
ncbi:MAG: hypothetical protein JWO62_803 [Acidimicrobiaceae bacterium]|nr:hypothetical protein [Acidimicrobiaceae bacterium]